VPQAQGVVLEVGIGSGLNLPYYDAGRVTKVIGLDPAIEITRMAIAAAKSAPFAVEFIDLPGEEIPLEDNSIDTILMTYTLCSIAEPRRALEEMQRVLRPAGKLLFCEHGIAPDTNIRRWQSQLNPIWNRIGGGCHLDRDIPKLIEASGFKIDELNTGYIAGWRPASFNYRGIAIGNNPTPT
jgi:ubiquinone/menaquinone biosynthesis C-methylase UbiE